MTTYASGGSLFAWRQFGEWNYEESFNAKLEESGDIKISTGNAVNIKADDSVSSVGSGKENSGKISAGQASSNFHLGFIGGPQ